MKYKIHFLTFILFWLFFAANTFATEVRDDLLAVGEEAPNFTLTTVTGESVSLAQFHGKKIVVLYFYPRDFTPGCTQEAQDFRDDYEQFREKDAEVLGISLDDLSSHKAFAKKLELNFPVLSDEGGKTAQQYGTMGWIMAKRVTYIIGRDGKVKYVFSKVNPEGHSKEVLKVLEALSKRGT